MIFFCCLETQARTSEFRRGRLLESLASQARAEELEKIVSIYRISFAG